MRSLPTLVGLPAVVLTAFLAGAAPRPEGDAVTLFNGKDLTGWSIYVDPAQGNYRADSSAKGVFKVANGQIHVSGERFGALSTNKEYENYRLSLEFRWGKKKWPPRENAVRDSGILMHCVGPDKIWPKSIECQIQEQDCGDFWMVDGAALTVDGKRLNAGRAAKKADAEKPSGEWNTVEVTCDGTTIINKINGVEVNRGTDASVKKGRIILQSEGAEIFFRNVVLRPL